MNCLYWRFMSLSNLFFPAIRAPNGDWRWRRREIRLRFSLLHRDSHHGSERRVHDAELGPRWPSVPASSSSTQSRSRMRLFQVRQQRKSMNNRMLLTFDSAFTQLSCWAFITTKTKDRINNGRRQQLRKTVSTTKNNNNNERQQQRKTATTTEDSDNNNNDRQQQH